MSNSTPSILVPIDSTEQTIIALNQSYNLARLTQSKIVLLTVDEENGEEIARLHGEDGSKEIYIKELKQPLEEHFNVDILTFEGYHYTEIQDAFEGFVFRIA